MPPENLPTTENTFYNNHNESDWWFIDQLDKLIDFKNNESINSIKNSSFAKWWKLSLSTVILLLFVLAGINYSYQNRENIISLFPNTTQYTVSAIQNTKIIPSVVKTITTKYDLTAAMVYLKQVSSKDDGTIVINEGNKQTTLEKPVKIKIAKIGVNSIINNPTKSDLTTLNNALNLGAVRYPESGLLGENKNIFIFGHSTSLTTEKDYYKTFNKLETLSKGDEIIIESSNNSYIYKVSSVKKTNTANGAIRIDSGTQKLTLSTCNTLGAKEDRFVVEADFVKVVSSIGGNIVSPTPITPGNQQNNVYKIDPTVNPVIEGNWTDLGATIEEVGILDSNNNFVATSTFSNINIGAVRFTVKNIGDKTSENWTFNAVLPTSPAHIFHSAGQKALAPGEKIEFTMGFDKAKIGAQQPIIINVDPTGGMKESNKTNNIVKAFVDIFDATN